MPNNTDPAREAAWNQSPTYYRICDGNEPDPCRAEADWKSGYDAGAASIDRVEIGKAVKLLREGMESTGVSALHYTRMRQAVTILAAYEEKGKC